MHLLNNDLGSNFSRLSCLEKIITAVVLSVCLVILAAPVQSQENATFAVALKINEEIEQFSGQVLASAVEGQSLVYTSTVAHVGQAPGGVLLKLERVKDPPLGYRLTLDLDGDGKLENDQSQILIPNASIIVRVKRQRTQATPQYLPYRISYNREKDRNGNLKDWFLWVPHYRAEGRLKVKNCDSLFVLMDLDNNGQFDSEDLSRGTSIGLDRNGDGRIWGTEEYLSGNQIIEYCGEAFLVKGLALDGTSVTLANTALRTPHLGDELPAFSLVTTDGQTIDSRSLKGRVHLLDFWASWCKPCVEKFDLVKRLSVEFKDVSIIAMNVDEESRLTNAKQIIKDYGLPWPHVMSGRGESDPIWQMFGGMEGNRLAIPLYVVVDREGRVRYAGNGGNDLSELRGQLTQLQLGK